MSIFLIIKLVYTMIRLLFVCVLFECLSTCWPTPLPSSMKQYQPILLFLVDYYRLFCTVYPWSCSNYIHGSWPCVNSLVFTKIHIRKVVVIVRIHLSYPGTYIAQMNPYNIFSEYVWHAKGESRLFCQETKFPKKNPQNDPKLRKTFGRWTPKCWHQVNFWGAPEVEMSKLQICKLTVEWLLSSGA